MVKLNVRDRESIQEAVRRFRKLVERSGIKKEMRRREYYEKPSETRRRARLRAERRSRRTRLFGRLGYAVRNARFVAAREGPASLVFCSARRDCRALESAGIMAKASISRSRGLRLISSRGLRLISSRGLRL